MENSEILQTSHESGVLKIKLNRPDALNALNAALIDKLQHVLESAKLDKTVRAILLTGEGKAFCAGADITQLAKLNGQSGYAFAQHGQKVFRLLEQLGKPSIAAINGYALGGGCELAMAATIRIASTKALFGQPEIKLGVIPGFGGTQRLSRLIGKGRALDLCLTGRTIKAEEALAWGLVTDIASPEELLTKAQTTLDTILGLGPIALRSIMAVVDPGYDLALEDAFALEAAHFGLCCATKDKEEGVKAFIDKRTAVFCGE